MIQFFNIFDWVQGPHGCGDGQLRHVAVVAELVEPELSYAEFPSSVSHPCPAVNGETIRHCSLSTSMSLQVMVGGTCQVVLQHFIQFTLQDAGTSFGPAEQYLALSNSPLLLNVKDQTKFRLESRSADKTALFPRHPILAIPMKLSPPYWFSSTQMHQGREIAVASTKPLTSLGCNGFQTIEPKISAGFGMS